MCQRVPTSDGRWAIVCGGHARDRQCKCGRRATLQCDWKMPNGRTCDTWICNACTTSPAPDKDLCRKHADAYRAWRAERTQTQGRRAAL